MREERLLLDSLPTDRYTLKRRPTVIIRQVAPRLFEGRFKGVPVILRCLGGTRPSVLRKLGRGLVRQYELVKGQDQTLYKKIIRGCERLLEPVTA